MGADKLNVQGHPLRGMNQFLHTKALLEAGLDRQKWIFNFNFQFSVGLIIFQV